MQHAVGQAPAPAATALGAPLGVVAAAALAAVDGTARPGAVLEPGVPEALRAPLHWQLATGPLVAPGSMLTPDDCRARGDGDRDLAVAAAAMAAFRPTQLAAILADDGDAITVTLPVSDGTTASLRMDRALPCGANGVPLRAAAGGGLFFARLDAMRRRLGAAAPALAPTGLPATLALLLGRKVAEQSGRGLDLDAALARAAHAVGAPLAALSIHGDAGTGRASQAQAMALAAQGAAGLALDRPLALVGRRAATAMAPAQLALQDVSAAAGTAPSWLDEAFLAAAELTLVTPL